MVFLGLYYFANDFYHILSEPLRKFLPPGSTMIATDVASPSWPPEVDAGIGLICGASPCTLPGMELCPGLYRHEKVRSSHAVFQCSLFYAGALFAYLVVFPLVFAFLTGAAPGGHRNDRHQQLPEFCPKLFLAFGLAFQIPIATLLMIKTGATSVASLLKSALRDRRLLRHWHAAYPPDVISQTLLQAIPMVVAFRGGRPVWSMG